MNITRARKTFFFRVWTNRSFLKGSSFYVSEDLPASLQKEHNQLFIISKEAKKLPEYKDKVFLKSNKLSINNKIYTCHNSEQKQLGRHISDFESVKWGEYKYQLLEDILREKQCTRVQRNLPKLLFVITTMVLVYQSILETFLLDNGLVIII